MSPWEKAIVANEIGLATAVMIGLFLRGHWRTSYTFTLYLGAFVLLEGAILAWPGRLFRRDFWMAKEAVEGLLKLAVAFEIAERLFQRLPTARATFAFAFWAALLTIAVAVGPSLGYDAAAVTGVALPRLLYWIVLILSGLLAIFPW